MKKIKEKLLIIMILSLTLTACGIDKEEHMVTDTIGQTPSVNPTDQVPSTDSTKRNNEVTSYEDVTLKFVDAFNIYTEKFPGTKIKKIELDKDYGEFVYEVEGYDDNKEYGIKIHPVSGEILKERTDNDDDNHSEVTLDHAQKVEGIIGKALKEAGENVMIKEVILKNKKGRPEVEVEIDKKGLDDVEYKYDIDGNLLEID